MEKDVLSQVIEAEKEIQKCIDAEKVKAKEWLEGMKKESEEEVLREQRTNERSVQESLRDADRQADERASEIVRDAEAAAERLGGIDNDIVTRIVRRRISRILPG